MVWGVSLIFFLNFPTSYSGMQIKKGGQNGVSIATALYCVVHNVAQ